MKKFLTAILCVVLLVTMMPLYTGAAFADETDWSKEPLCFTAVDAGAKVSISAETSGGYTLDAELLYSTDNKATWQPYTIGNYITLGSVGDKVYFIASDTNKTFSKEKSDAYYKFNTSYSEKRSDVSGNIMSLLRHDDFASMTSLASDTELTAGTDYNSCFANLFFYCDIASAENLVLPATTLTKNCYQQMFKYCHKFTAAPSSLPATTLAESCYEGMFDDCYNMTTAPDVLPAMTMEACSCKDMFNNCKLLTVVPNLPATTLAESCYEGMFSSCVKIETAPNLPAETMAKNCYKDMFSRCEKLVNAPVISATSLAESCFEGMFGFCSKLTTAPDVLPAMTLADYCYKEMFQNCDKLTTAPLLPATTLAKGCYDNMFVKCRQLTTAPELPAATMTESCYSGMFYECENLAYTPILSAETLAKDCYDGMFFSCKKLVTATELPAETLYEKCYYNMFCDCENLKTAPELPAATMTENCYANMFANCSSLENAPELKSEALAKSCYSGMFSGCSNLTDAPLLPATTLADSCYSSMFSGCSNLTDAPLLPATTMKEYCYSCMFSYCTKLTAAPLLPATTLADSCYSSMFSGCASLTDITVGFTDWNDATGYEWEHPTYNWVNYIGSTGTFHCPYALPITQNTSHIPSGWDISPIYEIINNTSKENEEANQGYLEVSENAEENQTVEITVCPKKGSSGGYVSVMEEGSLKATYTDGSVQELPLTPSGSDLKYYFTMPAFPVYISAKFLNELPDSEENISYWKDKPLCFIAKKGDTFVFLQKLNVTAASLPDVKIQYSTDTNAAVWKDYSFHNGILLKNIGDRVYFRAKDVNKNFSKDAKDYFIFSAYECTINEFGFVSLSSNDAEVEICGNIMSLLNRDHFASMTSLAPDTEYTAGTNYSYCFNHLFTDCPEITSAVNLVLPAATLTDNCYSGMFSGQKLLKKAPKLPAQGLAKECYKDMFRDCKALVTPSDLPAAALKKGCYQSMFENCDSLENAPEELPAMVLEENCYDSMFENCESLLAVPSALPALTLANKCYYQMFCNCKSLENAPSLPATTLADSCYYQMFSCCDSLKTAPELPAATMTECCYTQMFEYCSSLTNLPTLSATLLADWCYNGMFAHCINLTSVPSLPATILADNCYNGMFAYCEKIKETPDLPAENLKEGCYEAMFRDCKSLVSATDLPARTLVKNCYRGMFLNCASLTDITVGFTDWSSQTNATDYWMNHVATNGNFNCYKDFLKNKRGYGFIPEHWAVNDINTHIHDFEYVSSGNTATANCIGSEGMCSLGGSVSMTLKAADIVYNGSPYSLATLTNYDIFKNTTSATISDFVYWDSGDAPTKLDFAPQDAGKYKVKVSVVYDDGSIQLEKEFKISPKPSSGGGAFMISTKPAEEPKSEEKEDDESKDEEIKALFATANVTVRTENNKKGIKVYIKDTPEIARAKEEGYKVVYDFYRAVSKSKPKNSKYKITKIVNKEEGWYLNTSVRKGRKYWYKAIAKVFDDEGNLITSTELSQGLYGSRTR